MIWFVLDVVSLFLFSVTIWPVFENILSHGTEVAIIQSLFLTSWKSLGYTCFRCCHHTKGLVVRGANGSPRYLSNSTIPADVGLDKALVFTTCSSNSFHNNDLDF